MLNIRIYKGKLQRLHLTGDRGHKISKYLLSNVLMARAMLGITSTAGIGDGLMNKQLSPAGKNVIKMGITDTIKKKKTILKCTLKVHSLP